MFMIGRFGYERVITDVYAHKLSMRILTSTYEDRSKFVYVIVRALNMSYSLSSFKEIAATT